MFQFTGFPPHALCIQTWVARHNSCGVAPFGYPRIKAFVQLPEAFRRLRVLRRQIVPRHSPYTLSSLYWNRQFDSQLRVCSMRQTTKPICYCQGAFAVRQARSGQRQERIIPNPAPNVKGAGGFSESPRPRPRLGSACPPASASASANSPPPPTPRRPGASRARPRTPPSASRPATVCPRTAAPSR